MSNLSFKLTAENLWDTLKKDYKSAKGDVYFSTDGEKIVDQMLELKSPPARIRAAFAHFLTDTAEGDKHGYNMSRFQSSATKYFDRSRAGDGTQPKEEERRIKGSPYYKCDRCGRECTGLLTISEAEEIDEYPEVWAPCDPYLSPNNLGRPIPTGCGGNLIQVKRLRSKWDKVSPPVAREAVKAAVAEASEALSAYDYNEEIDFFDPERAG